MASSGTPWFFPKQQSSPQRPSRNMANFATFASNPLPLL